MRVSFSRRISPSRGWADGCHYSVVPGGVVCAGNGQEVTTDDMEIVSVLREALADKVGKKRFELWFGESTQLELADGVLTIGAPTRFFLDWIRSNFRRQIESACTTVLGECPVLEFRINAALPDPRAAGSDQTGPAKDSAARLKIHGIDGTPEQTANPQTVNGSGRRRFANFESFVTGQSNRLARASAEMVTQCPGQFSPLLVHGPSGVGKTHLLESIWTAMRRKRCEAAAVYLSAEQFTSYYVEAVRGSGLPSFRRKYRGVGVLLIDDLQFFRGKRSTLVELLYTVDTLLRAGRQVVFSADRAPAELAELGPELITRLESGMVCRIDPPGCSTRLGIVEHMARRLGLKVPKNVHQFVAARLTGHTRELSGALCRLQATSEALEQPITLRLAEEALADMIRHSSRALRLPDIEKAVCDVFGLDPSSLHSGRKAKRVSHPRMLAMWLARKHTRAALSEIGDFFGHRSHSTVISAQKRVDAWLASGSNVELPDQSWNVDDAIRQVERHLLAG